MAEHKNIGEAWLAVMEQVGYVQKTGHNKAQGYKYAGERQLIEALRPALMDHKIICLPSAIEVVDSSVVVTGAAGAEKKTYRTVAKYTFVYTHVPSGTNFQVEVVGEGVDTGDKAAYKAATGALKYALRQPFLIETGDEPEAHDVEEKTPNTPHGGVKTPHKQYGGNKQMYAKVNEIKTAIAGAVEPDHFVAIQADIDVLELVSPHEADELQKLLDEQENKVNF